MYRDLKAWAFMLACIFLTGGVLALRRNVPGMTYDTAYTAIVTGVIGVWAGMYGYDCFNRQKPT